MRFALAACLGATLVTTSAGAQLPPWAGHPIEPPPSFLVVPPALGDAAEVARVASIAPPSMPR